MRALLQDFRYAVRALKRAPGFTAAAVVTLALGIGATTTIFTVVNGVLLRPLAYPHANRIANIWNDFGEAAQSLPAVSPLDFRDYQRRSRAFEAFAAASAGNVAGLQGNLTGSGEPERVDLATVTANFFPLFGITPAYGRNFVPEEETPNGPHVVMLSDRLWRRRFGADPALVGKPIQLDGVAYTVVGILPRDFRLALPSEAFLVTDAEVWAPLQFDYGHAPPRNYTFFTVFGRLKRGHLVRTGAGGDERHRAAVPEGVPGARGHQRPDPGRAAAGGRGEARAPGAARAARRGRAGAAHRLRQRRPPAPGPGHGAGGGVRAPRRAWGKPLGHGTPTAGRELGAGAGWRRARTRRDDARARSPARAPSVQSAAAG